VKKEEIRVFQREEDKVVAARSHDKKDLTIITIFDSFHKVESNDENNKIKRRNRLLQPLFERRTKTGLTSIVNTTGFKIKFI